MTVTGGATGRRPISVCGTGRAYSAPCSQSSVLAIIAVNAAWFFSEGGRAAVAIDGGRRSSCRLPPDNRLTRDPEARARGSQARRPRQLPDLARGARCVAATDRRRPDVSLLGRIGAKPRTEEDRQVEAASQLAQKVGDERLRYARANEAWEEIPKERLVRRARWLVDAETDFLYAVRPARAGSAGRRCSATCTRKLGSRSSSRPVRSVSSSASSTRKPGASSSSGKPAGSWRRGELGDLDGDAPVRADHLPRTHQRRAVEAPWAQLV